MSNKSNPYLNAERFEPEVRRVQIISATMICLARLGPEKTTVREISKQASVSPGLLNHHFKNKKELIIQTLIYANEEFAETRVNAVSDAGHNPIEKLKAYIEASFQPPPSLEESVGLWMAFWFLSWKDQSLSSLHKEIYHQHRRGLEIIITEITNEYDLTDHVQTNTLELLSLIDGLWLELALGHGTISLREKQAVLDIWLEKLLNHKKL